MHAFPFCSISRLNRRSYCLLFIILIRQFFFKSKLRENKFPPKSAQSSFYWTKVCLRFYSLLKDVVVNYSMIDAVWSLLFYTNKIFYFNLKNFYIFIQSSFTNDIWILVVQMHHYKFLQRKLYVYVKRAQNCIWWDRNETSPWKIVDACVDH